MRSVTKRKLRLSGTILFYIYLALVAYHLFFSEMMGRTEPGDVYRYNLHLFSEIRRYLGNIDKFSFQQFVINIFGNALVFVPIGFWIPMLHKHMSRLIPVAVWSVVLSLSIETIQLVSKVGIFDVDDIFLNTLGGIAGYVLYRVSMAIYKRMFSGTPKNSGGSVAVSGGSHEA